ncbi:MAG: hypothetical protein NC078_01535 [Ruminococcus sp.]|nr:hypothetical protein [Ruminococcus sp.]
MNAIQEPPPDRENETINSGITSYVTLTDKVTNRAAVRHSVYGARREQHAAAREGVCC